MTNQVGILCENTRQKYLFDEGTSLSEMASHICHNQKHPILGAFVNNELKQLAFRVYKPKVVRFIDITHTDGHRMYMRSLIFLFEKALADLVPGMAIEVQHSVSNGLYVSFPDNENPSVELIERISTRMHQLVAEDLPFNSEEILTQEAVALFRERGLHDKAELFVHRKALFTTVYSLGDTYDYFYGYLVPSTAYLQLFDLAPYFDGLLLRYPNSAKPNELPEVIDQRKMFEIVREHRNWLRILNLSNIGSINKLVRAGQEGDLIKVSEALHEKKVAEIADQIANRKPGVRIVLIAGPSSSGKTSFTKRLEVQLKVAGLQPVSISLDNYFVNREHTPRDARGEYNFEALEAIDIALFNDQLLALLRGNEVQLPTFDFATGQRQYKGNSLKIGAEHIVLIEGIHGLNPGLTPQLPHDVSFRIYVSALTQLSLDRHNRIPSTDHRLIRRIVRDHKYRKYSALDTLKRWASVRSGEEHYIFPFQEEADVMFNSSLMYELCILKRAAVPLLKEVYQDQPEYAEAKRLLKFLEYFEPISKKEVPPTSILREFVGGSSFHY